MRFSKSLKNGQEFARAVGMNALATLRAMPGKALMDAYLAYVRESGEGGCAIHWDGLLIGSGQPEADHEKRVAEIHPDAVMVGAMADEFTFISGGAPMLSRMWPDTLAWAEEACVSQGVPCHVYRFERKLPGDDAGAFHSGELWYVFETLNRSWRPFAHIDQQLAAQMSAYWTNFIRTGNPNGADLPQWSPYQPASGEVLRINEQTAMGTVEA